MNQAGVVVHPAKVSTGWDWAGGARRVSILGNLQQVVSTEDAGGYPAATPDAVLTVWTLFTTPDVVIANPDRFEQNGLTFEVVGNPGVVYWPGGAAHHLEVQLRTVQ